MRGKFRLGAAMPFIAILLAVAAFAYLINKEGDARADDIEDRIEAEARLREDLATETRDRVADNERQIASLKATNKRQTRLILALVNEFPQIADELGVLAPVARIGSTGAYQRPPTASRPAPAPTKPNGKPVQGPVDKPNKKPK